MKQAYLRGARQTLLAVALALTLGACSYYSFTGATIPQHLGTVAIPLAEDVSTSPITDIDDDLTRLLVERFVGQTRLSLEQSESNADATLNVQIQRYTTEPTAVGGGNRATQNRLTIVVMVRYRDRVEDRMLIDRTFQSSEEYNPLEGGLEAERTATAQILENIADDIFTAATSNW